MTERQLLNSAPKQVSLYDSKVHLRFDLDNPPKRVPQHFTNIHAGLRLARSLLMSRSGAGEQADHRRHRRRADRPHRGPGGRPDLSARREDGHAHAGRGQVVVRGQRDPGLQLRLIEDYFYLGLVNFVEEMARVSQGVAAYCSADDLGKYVFDSFIGGRRARKTVK